MVKGNTRYYNLLPAGEWNNDLTLLSDPLQFLEEEEEEGHFCLPQDWKRLFSMSRLATIS